MRKILRAVAPLALAAGLLATPSTGVIGSGKDIDLGEGKEALHTGALANFEAKGSNLIRLLAGAFDPASGALPAGSAMGLRDRSTLPAGTPQYWLVQVRDKRYADVVAAIAKAGGQIAGTVPDATYMVRATPTQRDEIARSSAVRWAGYYQPAWRIPVAAGERRGLLELSGTQRYRVHVFADDPSRGSVGTALKQMAGVKVVQDAGVVVDVEATAAQLPAIAALPAVEWIGTPPTFVKHNFNARWVNDTGVRDLYGATLPGRLNGAGQVAAVADTGINYKLDLNGRAHINFRDCDAAGVCKEAIYTQVTPGITPASRIDQVQNNGTGHRKMVAYFDLGQAGPNMFDESSHGTHTAGSVTGDKSPFGSWQGADGMAPGAGLVHQNTATTSGGLGGIPADEYDMLRQAYRPRNPAGVSETSPANGNVADYSNYVATEDARTHNNSWGALYNVVDDGTAMRFDRFVWDHEDMVVVASAGNDGPGTHTISSPALAKNDFTSGASANGRQPMVSIDSMAIFSSHGPTGDGRFGTDLATPGQIVVSAKGGTVDDEHTAQGTSMSAPVLTGLATLTRQYFWDGYGPAGGKGFAGGAAAPARKHNPSAALVKAALSNGAVRMRGWYTGDDGQVRTLDGQWPSMGQGFGLVNLDNALYFANDPTNNWYHDVWRGDAEAFGAGTGATRTYTMDVQAGDPLDVTLAWTDAPSLLPAGTPALVNNLNLTVTGPGGTYVGNNMNSRSNPGVAVAETPALPAPADSVNTIERVRINAPAAGTYTITVTGASVLQGMQGYALAASGRVGTYTPGPARQRDAAGTPTISDVKVEPVSANTAVVRFTTSEPTTATATAGGATYVDSYNVGSGGFPGLNEGTVETSAEYGDKPVLGTSHEILMTGLSGGQSYAVQLTARDMAGNTQTQTASLTSPAHVYQADAPDIGYFSSGPSGVAQWRTGTQMYAGTAFVDPLGTVSQRHLGAWMFRVPEGAIDPNTITGAVVETTARHNWVVQYTADTQFSVDLLDESVEPGWGTQNYNGIRGAARAARVFPETGYERGGGKRYAFTFNCSDLAALKSSLSTAAGGERKAAFRYEATQTDAASLFSMDFGFNRRSSGPEFRPRLVLYTGGNTNPTGEACDQNAPAPVIEEVGIQDGLTDGSVTVTWKTDNVASDSMVLFREQGTTEWTQVGTPARTKVHGVQVQGLDSAKFYEFVVRSRACNGATATDANGGAGYDFFRHVPDPGPRTQHGTTFDFETGSEGWTAASSTSDQTGLESRWTLGPTGDASTNGWHVANTVTGVHTYHNFNETTLTAPAPVSFGGQLAAVEFSLALDTEATFDFLHVEYSSNGGATWTNAGSFDGYNGHPDYSPAEVRFLNPGAPTLVRFRFNSDELLSGPAFQGVSVDRVAYASYPNAPPTATESLPLTGPVPPPSAGATSLTAPPTRGGSASAADIAAGTGACVVATLQPDLRVSSLAVSESRPQEGKTVTLTATVTNGGDAAAPASLTEFRRDGTAVLGTVATPALAAGQSATVSVQWDTKHQKGNHTIRATADVANAVAESNESNNSREITVEVRGNKVQNGSFESDANSDAAPDSWTSDDAGSAGQNSWSEGGSDGDHSATSSGNGGNAALIGSPTWTSQAIEVTPGETLELVADVRSTGLSSAPTAGLIYLGALGDVLGTVHLLTAPLQTTGFTTLEKTVTIPAGVAKVRVVLAGFAATDVATSGTVTFDDVGLFAK